MKNLLFLFIVGILFGCEPKNRNNCLKDKSISESEHLVMATDWYQQSAEMRACYYQAFNLAKLQLAFNVEKYAGQKPPAVVLDIDETVLDNSPFEVFLINTGQLYSPDLWKQWTDKASAKALPGALNFTKQAQEMGVEVIYISNRKVNELTSTLKNLHVEGFPNADSAHVFLKKETSDKTARRNRVLDEYEVLLFIGDNLTDFSQAFAHRGDDLGFNLVDEHKNDFGSRFIILPNPMYGEWEGAIYSNDYSLSPLEKRKKRKQVLTGF